MDVRTGSYADLSAQQRADLMCELRAEGYSLQEIGERFGVTRERVRQIIRRADGPTKQEAEAARRARAALAREELHQRVLKLCQDEPGLTAAQVARQLGVSPAAVRAVLGDRAGRILVSTYEGATVFTNEAILDHLRQAVVITGEPLTVRMYEDVRGSFGGASAPLVLKRFGSWRSACAAAGVTHGQPLRESYARRWSDDQLVESVARYLDSPGVRGSFADYERWARATRGEPSGQTVRTQLGGWTTAKVAALSLLARNEASGR